MAEDDIAFDCNGDGDWKNNRLVDQLRKLSRNTGKNDQEKFLNQRHFVVKVLELIRNEIEPFMRRRLDQSDEELIMIDHYDPYVALSELVSALKDLDHGPPDPILQSGPNARPQRLGWRRRQEDHAVGELLQVIGKADKLTQRRAANWLAQRLANRGYRRDGERLTANQLIRIRHKKFQ